MTESPLFALLGYSDDVAIQPEPRAERVERRARVYRDAQVSILRVGPTGDGGQLAEEREDFAGWEEELNAPKPMMWPACRPPDGDQCGRVSCRHNLRLDFPLPVGERVTGDEPWLSINEPGRTEVGRRPSLTPAEKGAAVDAFIDEAADLSTMKATCSLLEIEKRGAMPEQDVADLLGVDPETVRRETVSALAKLKALASRGGHWSHDDNAENGLHAMLRALTGKP